MSIKIKVIVLTVGLLFMASVSVAQAEEISPCQSPYVLFGGASDVSKIVDILTHYNDTNYLLNKYHRTFLTGDSYCIAFQLLRGGALVVSQQITFEKLDELDVQLEGLALKSSIPQPVLRVVHTGGEGKIQLQNISVEDGGISLEAKVVNGEKVLLPEDAMMFVNSSLIGASKENNCLTISAPGTILDDVTVSNCAEGIRVEADDVKIRNSEVKSNKVGIHVTNGYIGTDINRTLIYSNDDGNDDTLHRFDGLLIDKRNGVTTDLVLFDAAGGEPVFFDPIEDIAVYEGTTARIWLPEQQGSSGRVELYLAKSGECGIAENALNQPCRLIDNMPIEITPEKLAQEGGVQFPLEQKYMEKQLVAIYTTPEEGSTAISQKFTLLGEGEGGVVAFVQTPYDIPTPGGGVDDIDVATGGTDQVEVMPTGDGMDSGGSLGGAAGPTARCSLVPHAQRGLLGGFGTLWWIFAALAALGTTRLCRAHIHRN